MERFLFFSLFASLVFCSPFGGLLAVSTCTGQLNQQWKLDSKTQNIVNSQSGMCLDVQSKVSADNQPVQLYTCMDDKRANQKWSYSTSTKQIVGLSGRCLALQSSCSANMTRIVTMTCKDSTAMEWDYINGSYVSVQSGLCLTPKPKPLRDANMTKPLIIGHKGYPDQYPENSLLGYEGALLMGADGIETDLRMTKDGHIAISHDESLKSSSNCTGKMSDYTLEYVTTQCDIGSKFGDEFKGVMIPSFEDVIKIAVRYDALVVMDMKENGLVNEIKRILDKYNFYKVIASMWYQEQLDDVKVILPNVPRQRLTFTHILDSPSHFAKETADGVMGYSCNFVTGRQAFIKKAHKSLMSVVIWTPKTMREINEVFDANADGIIVDDVELALWIALERRYAASCSV